MKERWVISGGRKYGVVLNLSDPADVERAKVERALFFASMNKLVRDRGNPSSVITGGAPGTDTLGEEWRVSQNLPGAVMKADWAADPRRAGIKRNVDMLRVVRALKGFKPVVIHTPGGNGTAHMVQIATLAGVECVPICGATSVFDMLLI